jgi:hypothetical protein
MPEENVEAMEHAMDIFWQQANADVNLAERGIPLAVFESNSCSCLHYGRGFNETRVTPVGRKCPTHG